MENRYGSEGSIGWTRSVVGTPSTAIISIPILLAPNLQFFERVVSFNPAFVFSKVRVLSYFYKVEIYHHYQLVATLT